MYRIALLTVLLAISIGSLRAQEKKDFAYFDKTTYRLYETGDWSVLLMIGQEALQAGHDYYYLRMRMGVAFYELGKYPQAQTQFRKALKFNADDPVALWYLFYSYRFAGMAPEAERLQQQHAVLRKDPELPDPQGFLYRIYSEGGGKISSVDYPVGNVYFGHLGFGMRFSPSVRMYNGYQYLQLNIGAWEERNGQGQGQGGNLVFVESPTRQHEYYGQLEITPARGLRIMPSYHFLLVDTDSLIEYNHVASLGLSWRAAPWLALEGAFSYSQIAMLEQLQATGGIVFYPLGTNALYLMARGIALMEGDHTEYALYLKPGFRIAKSTWLEGSYTLGNLRHMNEWNGFVVFNNPDDIDGRWNVTLNQGIGSHVLLNLNFQSESKRYYLDQSPYTHYGVWAGINLDF